MKRILTIAVGVLFASSANAIEPFTTKLDIVCDDAQRMIDSLEKQYDEELSFLSRDKNDKGENISYSLWVNHTTHSWSFVAYNQPRSIACLLSSGKEGVVFAPPSI